MTVWADLAFILGIMSGFLGTDLAFRFLDLRRSRLLRGFCALFSGVLQVAGLLWQSAFFLFFVWLLFFSFVFHGRNLIGTVRNFGMAMAILLLWFGGVLFLLFVFFSVGLVFTSTGVYFEATFFSTAACELLSYGILRKLTQVRRRKKGTGRILNCAMLESGTQIPLRCYEDSGNFLRDPLGDRPIVIVEYGSLKKKIRDFPFPGSYAFSARFGPRFRVIPCRFAAGEGQMMYGFVAEDFIINGKSFPVTVCVSGNCLDGRGRFNGIIGNLLSEVDACDGVE